MAGGSKLCGTIGQVPKSLMVHSSKFVHLQNVRIKSNCAKMTGVSLDELTWSLARASGSVPLDFFVCHTCVSRKQTTSHFVSVPLCCVFPTAKARLYGLE